jgi:hypothetical protein
MSKTTHENVYFTPLRPSIRKLPLCIINLKNYGNDNTGTGRAIQ